MSPRVSVLIPTHNYGRFLAQALESVFAQSYSDYEVIVVDDGSTDDTREVASKFPQVRYLYQEQTGVATARNRLLEEAQGEFAAFLDADDLWLPDKLEKQVAYMEKHPDCGILFTAVQNISDRPHDVLTEREQQLMDAALPYALPTACIRMELVRKLGGFSQKYTYGEDTEWLFRLRAAGVSLAHCLPQPLYLRRIHGENLSLTHTSTSQKECLSIVADAIRRAKGRK